MPDGNAAPLCERVGASLPGPRVPGQLAALAVAIGEAGVLRLVEARGGTVVYVPGRTLSPSRGLGKEIGLDAAACRRLAALLGNDRLKVPLVRQWRAQIYRAEGLSYTQIARRLGVTETAVWSYLRNAGLTGPQLTLDL